MGLGGIQAALVILLVQGCILPAAGQSAGIVPVRAGWMEGGLRGGRQKKEGTVRFVYLSVLTEQREQREQRAEKVGRVVAAAALEVLCPVALDLFVSGGGNKIKGETDTKRGRAINITQAAA
ncbi:hypothetical protein VZT92_021900 [Zoarces viviparus]|uniref:Uncharacterized protein n=1 Tax=Zoarces viviparus TaxID=48416 RepID=A0AAW1E9W6_ZOAVI